MTTSAKELEKAYGNCRNCFGKGYATVQYGLEGHEDFGGDGFRTPAETHMKLCSCERGKQLGQLIEKQIREAVVEELETCRRLYTESNYVGPILKDLNRRIEQLTQGEKDV